jgi:hypothetical protein
MVDRGTHANQINATAIKQYNQIQSIVMFISAAAENMLAAA